MNKLTYLLSLIYMLALSSCEADKVYYHTAAEANFTIGAEVYELGQTATFTDASLPNDGSEIVSWLWEFGDADQSTSTVQNPTFIYPLDGTFTIKLTVTDNNGLKATAKKDLTIMDPTKIINVMWQKDLGGKINSGISPVLSPDGTVVYMYANAAEGLVPALMAYDVTNGDLKWSFDINKAMRENHSGGSTVAGASDIFCSLSVGTNGDIYFVIRDLKDAGSNRRLFTFAVKSDGRLSWIHEAPDANIYAISPAIDAVGNIYVGNRGKELCVFSKTGELLKTFTLENEVVSGLSLSKAGDIYFGSNPTSVFCYNSATGTKTFASDLGGSGLKANSYTIGEDNTIYTATAIAGGSGVVAIHSDGTRKWTYAAPGEIVDGGVVIAPDGTLYATGGKVVEGVTSGGIIALNGDGTLNWHYATPDDVSGSIPLVDNRGYIHFFSDKAVYYIVKPNGTLLSSAILGVKTSSSPVMNANGHLFIGVETVAGVSKMVCISSGATSYADSAWPMKGQNPQRTGLQK